MLVDLKIENILLMDNLHVEFNDGLTAITGQTGAGKSVLIDSIGIILGKRAETSLLRDAEKHGIIVATFKVENQEIINHLHDNGFIGNNEDLIIIKKIITKHGSKIFINDIQTTVQFVNSIANALLEIYSQFEQTDLFNIKKHLTILDDFGHFSDDLSTLSQYYQTMKSAQCEYLKTKNEIDRQKENLEYLESFIQDVEALRLVDGEYEQLLSTKKNMVDSEKIATYIKDAYSIFNDTKIRATVNKVQDKLQRAESVIDNNDDFKNKIFTINEALESVYNSSQMAEELLADFASKHGFNEENLNDIEERITSINDISRKYQTTPHELQKQYEIAKYRVKKISFSDDILKNLLLDVNNKQQEYLSFARQLSDKRKQIAKTLENIVMDKLKNLKMEKVVFFVSFEECEPTENGIDKVIFFASMNSGLPPAPIHKIASGGELSRFMLAFKSALCGTKNTSTIIFDEIDTGVSGSTAFAIGKEMQHLALQTQVICITHNAQTAACAKEHLFVEKQQNFDIAKTEIKKLTHEETIRAIASMMSGDEITNEALMNAKKLITAAHM